MRLVTKAVIGLLAAIALSWAQTAYAVDNGTEFGVEDDLTVLGTGGTAVDPDLEVKGFSVFGTTQSAPALNIPVGQGNVFVNGYMQVSSGMYVAGSSTFTTRIKLPSAPNIFVDPGTVGDVMKRNADGSLYWAADNEGGAGTMTGTPLRLIMIEADGTGTAPSLFQQNADVGTNMTLVAGSSMTILGDGTDGLGVTGALKLTGNMSVNGNSVLNGILDVGNYAQFGGGVNKSTFSTLGSLDMALDANITLNGTGKITLPNLPALGTDAANKTYVDNQVATGGPWTRDNNLAIVKLSTITDSVGIGIAAPIAKLHVSSANAAASDMMFIVSTGTLASQQVMTVNAMGNTMSKGDSQQGDAVTDIHGVNMAPAADTALSVAGQNVAGDYAAKFYSGASLAAWIKKK